MRKILALVLMFSATTIANAEYVTVSLKPVANLVYNNMPNIPSGMQTLGGVPFDLLPTSGNDAWSGDVGTTGGKQSVQTMVLPVKISGATAIDTLINTYGGVDGSTYVSLSFVCTDGTTFTATMKEGADIRDWLNGEYVNKINKTSTEQVFSSTNHGRIDKQHITLPNEFANKTLSYIILTDAGITGRQRAILYGVTVTTNGSSDSKTKEPDQNSLDQLSQEMIDEAIGKLKGKEAKKMSDLIQKYQKDRNSLAQQRQELDDEMERDTLKVIVLSSNGSDVPKADQDILNSVDGITEKADPSDANTKSAVFAVLDKGNVWDSTTQAHQYKMFIAAPADKREQLLVVYRRFEPKYAAQLQSENTLQEQKKKDIFTILSPDSK